ncbi:bromodomain adjacent to zinc finger domain protein 2B-like isoform X3 [Oratosquilla oratoria]|uniref:bromodomain adjacent to zinc finger domain protein 2B-like isoform X3 n=1 Tax=Oratosquilla oratoria TaxID=337810 RepID=UPI003F774BA6
MDKKRERERSDKGHAGIPAGLDPATAALYAPWLHQEQTLLSNMFGGGMSPYNPSAAAAAAAVGLSGIGGLSGMGLGAGYPPTSSAAQSMQGLAGLAAAQQAQQAQHAAALASAYQERAIGAAWWNMANLQQMELLSRLQGSSGGSQSAAAAAAAAAAGMSGYAGLHPEHLMNLELLQAQHAAAVVAALSSSKASTSTRTSSSRTSSITSSLSSRTETTTTMASSSRNSRMSGKPSSSTSNNSSSSRSGSLDISRLAQSASPSRQPSSSSSHSAGLYSTSHHHHHHHPSRKSNNSTNNHSSSSSSSSSSYHLQHHLSNSTSSMLSTMLQLPPGVDLVKPNSSSSSSLYSAKDQQGGAQQQLQSQQQLSSSRTHRKTLSQDPPYSCSSLVPPHDGPLGYPSHLESGVNLSHGIASLMADKISPSSHKPHQPSSSSSSDRVTEKLASNGSVSISKALRNKELEIIPISPSTKGGSNQGQHAHPTTHKDRSEPKVSISTVLPSARASSPVGRLSNGTANNQEENANVTIEPCGSVTGEDGPLNLSLKSSAKLHPHVSKTPEKRDLDLNPLLPPPGLPPGLTHAGLTPSLEVLQSLYGHPGMQRDALASMQEALHRQLLASDDKKREEKRKRMEEANERARHLGRGVSKPKKNTVASLLEQCRAAGVKPQLPLPPTTSIASTPVTTSSPTHGSPSLSSAPFLSSSSTIGVTSAQLPPSSSLSLSLRPPSPALTTTSTPLPPPPPPLPPPPPPPVSVQSSSSDPPSPTVTISALPPPLALPTSLPSSSSSPVPMSLPASLSISSSVSITSISPPSTMTSALDKPSVTIQPATSSADERQPFKDQDHTVEITPISRTQENGGDKPIKKRHIVTSSSVDGRLITTIKAASGQMDISDLSADSDTDNESYISSADESMSGMPSPWLKRDITGSPSVSSGSPPAKKRKMITDEVQLRVPLTYGWRRETTMRAITQSGVRGEVIYYAPCGKPFRQYPDIIRYLEKNNIREVSRDNFSFSSKIPIGEYVDGNTLQRYTEEDIRQRINDVREKKGYKPPTRKPEDGRDALEVEAEAILRRLEAEEQAEKSRQEALAWLEERSWLPDPFTKIQREIQEGLLREQERIRKQEEVKREKEELRKQREEQNRQRLYEQLRKAQEREQEKQKQRVLKEQLYLQELNKQREMLYTLELERERRRYHGVLVRAIEARKRYEDRERRREELKEEKRAHREKKREERLAAKELSILMKEVKEDMELTDHSSLPKIPRLEGLKLSPEAFGNILMVFEFLHNFGETLGFDMDSLPSLQSLQLALLNDCESEEELLSVLSHLLVCAIEDPGIPSPQRHTTILGQTLNRADITHTNISEILRVYLYANATGEVRVIYGLLGTEKEKRENPKRGQEWDEKLQETEAYKMSQWLVRLPFLALSPTQKSEIVVYVCNELLQNKAVVRQIEDSIDKHNSLKTEKWKLDARIRRLRMSVARKRIYNAAMRTMMDHKEDSNMSSMSGVSSSQGDIYKKVKNGKEDEDEDKKDEDEEEEDEENESGNESEAMEEIPDEEDDKHLNADDASKTLELLQRQMAQVRQDLFETAQKVRGFNCGQDRYQRTMWVLPHAGGPYLEGLSSCDYSGRDHFPLEIPEPENKVGKTIAQFQVEQEKLRAEERLKAKKRALVEAKDEISVDVKEEIKVENEVNYENGEEKVTGVMKVEIKDEKMDFKGLSNTDSLQKIIAVNGDVRSEMSTEVPNIPQAKEEMKVENCEEENNRSDVPTPTKSDMNAKVIEKKDSQASPFLVNGVKDNGSGNNGGELIDKNLLATGLGLVPGQYLRQEHLVQHEKLTFSLLPRLPCDFSSLDSLPVGNQTPAGTPRASSPFSRSSCPQSPAYPTSNPGTPANPQSNLSSAAATPCSGGAAQNLSHRELLEKLHQTAEALPVPPEYKTGWWHVNLLDDLKDLMGALNERGVRERELKRFIEKNAGIVKNALMKVEPEATKLEALSDMDEEIFLDEFDTPQRDDPPHWSSEIALRVDMLTLDAVYAMEEKITNASMQNKSWCLGDSSERPCGEFRASCLPVLDANDTRINPVHLARERLMALEEGIERRYLKPPLGVPPNPKEGGGTESCSNSTSSNSSNSSCNSNSNGNCSNSNNVRNCETPKGLTVWREAVSKSETAAQLSMCLYMLETCVAWDKSIMKAYCQFCHSGDHEEKLLLCDGCDKGYHTHCFRPPMTNIPDGDWYCYECVNKFSESSQRHCLVCGGTEGRTLIHCSSCPRAYHTTCITPPIAKVPRSKWVCPACSSKSPRARKSRAKKVSETAADTPDTSIDEPVSASATPPPKKERGGKKKDQKELAQCKAILCELETHDDAWPFLLPVNTRQFPTYKKIIKKPMDLSTIKKKIDDGTYKTREDFSEDLRLMFNNCETFNEDDSPVGKAGHNLRSFFETKWNENFPVQL